MKFSKKLYIISLSALITVACSNQKPPEGRLIINNKTSSEISGISLTYKTTNKSENLGNLSAQKSVEYPIKYSDTEDSIAITYTDNNKVVHNDIAVPYFGKYEKKNYTYDIK